MKKIGIVVLTVIVSLGFSVPPVFAASANSKGISKVPSQLKTVQGTKAVSVKSTKGGPKISVQPKTTYFKVPYAAKLKVRAASPSKCTYKWQYYDDGWTNVNGGTKAGLTIPYTDKTFNNQKYRCVLALKTNSKKKTISKTVALKMKSIPDAYIIIKGKGYGPGDTWHGTGSSKGKIHISSSGKNIYMKNVKIKYNASKVNTAVAVTSVKSGYGYNIILSGENTIETSGKNNLGMVLFSLDSKALHTFTVKGGKGASLKTKAGGGSLYVCQAALEIGAGTHVNAALNKTKYNKDGFALNTCSLKLDNDSVMHMSSGSKACMMNSGDTVVEKGAVFKAASTAAAHVIACQMNGSLYINGGNMNVSMNPASGSKKSPNFIMEAVEFSSEGKADIENSGSTRGSLTTNIQSKYDGLTISGIVGGNMIVNQSDVKAVVNGKKIENADGFHLFGTMTVKNGADVEADISGKDMLTGISCNYDGLSKDDTPTGTIDVTDSNITADVAGMKGEQTGIYTRQFKANINDKQYKANASVSSGAALAVNLGMFDENKSYSSDYKPTGKIALSEGASILSPAHSVINQYSFYYDSLAEPYNAVETVYENGSTAKPAKKVSIGVK